MKTFTKESIEDAIQNIELNPDLIKGRESKDYDLILENGKTYPPILVLSEANKILGGESLVINDFYNSTRKPFNILRKLGFNVILKTKELSENTNSKAVSEKLDYKKFLEACDFSNLYISEQLAIRFIASLLTKPFVILTGLSGSGKTKLAVAFSKWISVQSTKSSFNTFSINEVINSNRVSYLVTATDKIAVTFTQVQTGIKATFPYELIYEWITVIRENKFTTETAARQIRDVVESSTKYSTQLNSFETHLKAAAFYLMTKKANLTALPFTHSICILPVGADWTNREPLLGYPNALQKGEYVLPDSGVLQLIIDANNNPKHPFFLILDEMNLSHVERYFADFLSAMESHEGIPLHSDLIDWKDSIPSIIAIPKNLFIIGTVNIDETTYMFSPKVLDRANVIEFRVNENEMKNYLEHISALDFEVLKSTGANMAESFVELSTNNSLRIIDTTELQSALMLFFTELKKTGAEFGYRSASEIFRFAAVANTIEPNWTIIEIIDAAVMQKLLPKVHGSRRKLEPILKTLGTLCLTEGQKFDDLIPPKIEIDYADTTKIKYPISLEKILRMYNGLISNGFTSYAEA